MDKGHFNFTYSNYQKIPLPKDDNNEFLLTIIADLYILMVFGLWLGYSILGMKIMNNC